MHPSARRLRSISLIACLVTAILAALHGFYFDPVRKAEIYTRDLRQCFGKKAALDDRLVFLAIDKGSVQLDAPFPDEIEASPALKLMKSGFPWSREVYSFVVQRLLDAGARVVILDLLFPEAGTGDQEFGATLKRYPFSVIIGYDFVPEQRETALWWRYDLPISSIIPPATPVDSRLGYVTFWPDLDGPVRRMRMQTSPQELGGATPNVSDERCESLEARTLRVLGQADHILDSRAHLFRFVGRPGTIPAQSLYQIFVPDLWKQNFDDGRFFKDKIVFVGPEGNWSHDVHATPFHIIDGDGALMAGPELHLNALNAALHSDFLEEPSPRGEFFTFLLAGCFGVLISLPRGPLWRTRLMLIGLAAYAVLAIAIYDRMGFLVPFVVPCAIVALTVLTNIIRDYRVEQREKQEIRLALGHYVGENVVEEILTNRDDFLHSLTGVRKTVTVMFTDLRDFTSLTLSRSPAELIAQLNQYFEVMTNVVISEHGSVDKLMGDGMMAIWGNLHSAGAQADALAAVRCALAMRHALADLNMKWKARGWPTLRFGVGLAHGEATIGNVGSERKMDFTAVGSVINKASRIEQITQQIGTDILIGADLAVRCENDFELASAGRVEVKGIPEPLPVFSVIGLKKAATGVPAAAVQPHRTPDGPLAMPEFSQTGKG